jgi:hypothetical protein
MLGGGGGGVPPPRCPPNPPPCPPERAQRGVHLGRRGAAVLAHLPAGGPQHVQHLLSASQPPGLRGRRGVRIRPGTWADYLTDPLAPHPAEGQYLLATPHVRLLHRLGFPYTFATHEAQHTQWTALSTRAHPAVRALSSRACRPAPAPSRPSASGSPAAGSPGCPCCGKRRGARLVRVAPAHVATLTRTSQATSKATWSVWLYAVRCHWHARVHRLLLPGRQLGGTVQAGALRGPPT